MAMNRFRWGSRRALAMLACALPLSVHAGGREVLCESKHGNHAYCSTGHHGSVHVMEAFGRSRCVEGSTWGTDSGGIWVDQGCYARFWVEDGNSGSDRHNDRAVAGAAIGAIAIAAILAGANSRDAAPAQAVPAAAPSLVGRFHAFDPEARADTMMDIDPGGRVYYYQLGQRYAGRLQDGRVYFDSGKVFSVKPAGTGFTFSQDTSPAAALAFERVQ